VVVVALSGRAGPQFGTEAYGQADPCQELAAKTDGGAVWKLHHYPKSDSLLMNNFSDPNVATPVTRAAISTRAAGGGVHEGIAGRQHESIRD
jgi:hypothetical protein